MADRDRTPHADADVIRHPGSATAIDANGMPHGCCESWPECSHVYYAVAARDHMLALLAEKDAQIEETTRENTALRGIASKIMPCHFCGAEEIACCPKGFPGCSLMDDVMGMEEGVMIALREARAEIERLNNKLNEDSQTFQIECQKAEIQMRTDERDALAAQVRTLTALREIRDQDWVNNVLDPQWAARIAEAALASVQQSPAEEQTPTEETT